jgi:hypothetical protein
MEKRDNWGNVFNLTDEIINVAAGQRIHERDLGRSFQQQINNYSKLMKDARYQYQRALSDVNATSDDLKEAHDTWDGYAKEHLMQMRRKFEKLRVLGFSEKELFELMRYKPQRETDKGKKLPSKLLDMNTIMQVMSGEYFGIDKTTSKFIGSGSGGRASKDEY